MSKLAPLHWLLILLVFLFVLSSEAVPTTRSFLPYRGESTTHARLDSQGPLEFRNEEEKLDVAEEFMVEGRSDLESNDYPGTGANNSHDPKTPGRD
ncbi:uncharacterized protein LOC130732560 [Lotus japonicus]|uniref:Uncharacterized protein n=1 Tax=Lotus japonicus TaxID=34305 RepID=I3SPZ1_LOTJA|nr:uncharacterized protein LOC130732560 [Lotus japonicus]AFK42333.1 unknown [Lotus japonicus]